MKIGIPIRHCLKKMSSNFLLELAPYFEEHELHIFTAEHDNIDGKKITWHRVPVISKRFSLQEISFMIFSTIIMLFNRFDVTMSQPTRFFSPDVAQMEFCYKGWQEYQKKMGLKLGFKDRLVPLVEGFNLRRAKKVIVTSEGIKKEIMKYYGVFEKKITVIPNGVNIERFKRNEEIGKAVRKELGIGQKDFVIIFVGRNLKRKGFEYLLKALPLLDRETKVIVAGGKDDYHQNLARELEQEKNVFFIGDVPNIERYFSAADVFVFPTFYEGFSLATIEAAACGLPLIAAKANGTEELIDNGKNGFLLKKREPKEIAKRINLLMANSNLREKMGDNARKLSLEYSWDKIAKRMLSVLEEAAEMKKKRY